MIDAPVRQIVMSLDLRSINSPRIRKVSNPCSLWIFQWFIIEKSKYPSSHFAAYGTRRRKLSSPLKSWTPSKRGVPLSIQRRWQTKASQFLAILVVDDRISWCSSKTILPHRHFKFHMFEWFGVCQDLRRRSRMNNFKWTDGTINDTLALMFMN